LEDDYHPKWILTRERGVNDLECDKWGQNLFLELEYLIENVICKRVSEKGNTYQMYKGDPKKWQVLNDEAFDREEIEKVQAAIKAPSPNQLDHNKWNTKKTVSTPFTNKNVEKWRDEMYFNDSADFSYQ
jgi:hypothetical protein